jgi:hypothetical protein
MVELALLGCHTGGMARKKPKTGSKMPNATDVPSKPRTGDRHKPRVTISFKPLVYEGLKELAQKNHRPIQWEADLMARHWLKQHGIVLPDSLALAEEEDE